MQSMLTHYQLNFRSSSSTSQIPGLQMWATMPKLKNVPDTVIKPWICCEQKHEGCIKHFSVSLSTVVSRKSTCDWVLRSTSFFFHETLLFLGKRINWVFRHKYPADIFLKMKWVCHIKENNRQYLLPMIKSECLMKKIQFCIIVAAWQLPNTDFFFSWKGWWS